MRIVSLHLREAELNLKTIRKSDCAVGCPTDLIGCCMDETSLDVVNNIVNMLCILLYICAFIKYENSLREIKTNLLSMYAILIKCYTRNKIPRWGGGYCTVYVHNYTILYSC